MGATRTRTDRPFTASTTGGRLPAPSVATSASVSSNPRFEGKKGHTQSVDRTSADADASAFDALVLPGGVVNADDLRLDEAAVAFTRAFFDAGKPVAVICHGGWILTDADVLRGRTMTSYKSLRTDLTNAGATWVDEEVVVDKNLITSRSPEDLPAFLDHSVRYSLVNVWLHESEQWLENVLVPLYRMGPDADDPAPVLPSLDAYLMRRRRRLGG